MKKVFLFFVFIVLIAGNMSCRTKDTQVLYVLSHDYDMLISLKRTNGDMPIYIHSDHERVHAFDVVWDDTGCVLNYISDGKDESEYLRAGQKREIEIYEKPSLYSYEVYLSSKDGEFPKSWNGYFKNMEQKAEFGTFERFSESRHNLDELNLIQTAFHEADLDQDAEAWYKVFLESIWYQNDFSIRIIKANVEHKPNDIFVMLHLFDDEGNEMIMYGFIDDSVDYIKYKGESYAGPFV